MLHSIGKFASHRVESAAIVKVDSVSVPFMSHLESCRVHGLPVRYFEDKDQEALQVNYGCESCIQVSQGHSFSKIDLENILNVH